MKKIITTTLITAIASPFLGNSFKQATKVDKKPNILFFLVDDMGYMDLGIQGSKLYETPNIDKLAKHGVRFTSAYVTHPRCVPSRYSLITGKYPARAQMPGPKEGDLSSQEITIGKSFKKAGYSTFFTGKWHLAHAGSMPEDHGFDVNVAGGKAGSPISFFAPFNEGRRYKGKYSVKHPITGLDDAPKGEYLTDKITDETIKYLKKQHTETPDKPFFAYVSHYAVHQPLQAKKEDVKYYSQKIKGMSFSGPEYVKEGTGLTKMHQNHAKYAGMVKSTDESLGRIVNVLKEMGELDNTIIIFFSDNGGLSNQGTKKRNLATSNYPLRAGKGHLYEGGVRVPLIVKWPGTTKQGMISDAVITGSDFYPTMLEMAGIPQRPDVHIDGRSFVWSLKNKKNPDKKRAIFWHSPVSREINTGDSKSSAIRQGKYKLIEWYKEGRYELYNIEKDISETIDISKDKPKISKKLLKKLRNWRKEVNAVP